MKLKQSPDDFRVEEKTAVTPGHDGPYAFYLLEKRNWNTPDAVENIRRRWKIDRRRFSFGGLKDRHAHTTQYLTIFHGPKRNLSQTGLSLHYLGQVAQEFTSDDISANRFTIALRALSAPHLEAALQSLEEITIVGVPNYFDDQRFGSVHNTQAFIAKEMVLGNFEQAAKLALTAPYEHDGADAKKEKAVLLAHWGNWPACRARLRSGPARQVIEYLEHHPDDFRGGLARLHPELQGLYLAAWQSHLWNRMLAYWLETNLPEDRRSYLSLQLGSLPVPKMMSPELLKQWETLVLPLPSARLRFDPSAVWASLVEKVMSEEGIALEEMKIKGMRKPFFSRGDRAALIRPDQLTYTIEPDEKHSGQSKLVLQFELPRGAYATMIVKRATRISAAA
jgi:tRNA pseudouridine13 synthase